MTKMKGSIETFQKFLFMDLQADAANHYKEGRGLIAQNQNRIDKQKK